MNKSTMHSLTEAAERPALTLQSELLRSCFSKRDGNSDRPVIWINAVCVVFLAVGLCGLRQPADRIREISNTPESTFVPIEVFQPPPPPSEAAPLTNPTANAEEASVPTIPAIPVIAIDDPAKAAFPVLLLNVTAVTNRVDWPAIPPVHDVPRREKLETGPKRWEGAAAAGVTGGTFPQPDFPREAVIRHESGTVEVLVAVKEDGSVESAEIQSSSGSAILDHHAQQFLKRKWHWPTGPRREFIVPVEFNLQK